MLQLVTDWLFHQSLQSCSSSSSSTKRKIAPMVPLEVKLETLFVHLLNFIGRRFVVKTEFWSNSKIFKFNSAKSEKWRRWLRSWWRNPAVNLCKATEGTFIKKTFTDWMWKHSIICGVEEIISDLFFTFLFQLPAPCQRRASPRDIDPVRRGHSSRTTRACQQVSSWRERLYFDEDCT